MKTNLPKQKPETHFIEKKYPGGVPSKVGEEIAFFHLGSSIVLVFESPEFLFTVKPGQKVRVRY
jgi:phosphatidylserine decarboxylase